MESKRINETLLPLLPQSDDSPPQPSRGFDVRRALAEGEPAERAQVIARLLTFAPWDEIWSLIEQDEVREIFPHLDLPENLRVAWARYLGL